jgi:hypothetical protein
LSFDTGDINVDFVAELYWCITDGLSVHMFAVISRVSKHCQITGKLGTTAIEFYSGVGFEFLATDKKTLQWKPTRRRHPRFFIDLIRFY